MQSSYSDYVYTDFIFRLICILLHCLNNFKYCYCIISQICTHACRAKQSEVLREVRTLAQLEHKNVVRYFSTWKDNSLLEIDDSGLSATSSDDSSSQSLLTFNGGHGEFLYIQMELCREGTLERWLNDNIASRQRAIVWEMFEEVSQLKIFMAKFTHKSFYCIFFPKDLSWCCIHS